MPEADLGALFKSFTRTAWRLETRDLYTVPSEASWLADFRAGRPLPTLTPESDGWLSLLREFRDTGRICGRVHVVSRPVTEYIEFEIALYRDSVAWGEDVRIADRAVHDDGLADLDEDFWVFDDTTVAVMRYDDAGVFHGAVIADDPAGYLAIRDRALAVSVPLAEFTERLTIGS